MSRGGALALTTIALVACRSAPPATPARACPTGPVQVRAQEDLEALAGCRVLAALEIRTAAPLSLTPLESLTAVEGDLVVGPTLGLASVGLPALETVGGALRLRGNGDLTGVYLPRLREVGALTATDDVALVQIMAPRLVAIRGPITIARVPALELIDTSAGPRVEGVLTVEVRADVAWIGRPDLAPAPPTPDQP